MALSLADLLTHDVAWQPTERRRDLYPVPTQPLDEGTTQRNTPHEPGEQKVATVTRAEVSDYYKALFDDTLKHNVENLKQLAATGDEVPIGPIINCSLRARDMDIQLRNLALRPYDLPRHEGHWRLTNRHDTNAPVVVSIDLVDVPDNAPSNMTFMGPGLPITIESRPTPKRTVRHLLDLYAFLQALHEPRVVEIVDEKTSQVRFTGYGVQVERLDPVDEQLIDALRTIQSTFFMVTFPIPKALTAEDQQEALRLAEILRIGQTVIPISNISAEMNTETVTNLLRYADKNGVLQHVDEYGVTQPERMHIEQELTAYTLFGVPLDLGPSRPRTRERVTSRNGVHILIVRRPLPGYTRRQGLAVVSFLLGRCQCRHRDQPPQRRRLYETRVGCR